MAFAYIGSGLTRDAFTAYVAGYDFGSIPPEWIVFHHTEIPDASWAPTSANDTTWWDRDEAGLSETAIRAKRNKQLDAIRTYYRDVKGWLAGPHLFIDDRWIWLFTPMAEVGIHAVSGNSYRDRDGRLHYSIGIEVVGDYTHVPWPDAIQTNVRHAVRVLRDTLKTFELVYRAAPLNRPDLHRGSISLHRDYNNPACPGDALSEDFIIDVLTRYEEPPDPWPGRWGPIALPDGPQWGWASVAVWKRHYDSLGQCRSHLLYDNDHHVIMQAFERGVTRQLGGGAWEVCLR